MIIAVDTLSLSKRFRYTGTGVYISHLLSECLEIAETGEFDIEFHGFMAPDDNWAAMGFVSPFLKVHETALMARRRLWLLGGMAMQTARVRPNLVFLPTAQGSVPSPTIPLVSTILDAMPKRLPSELLESGRLSNCVTWVSAKLARKIITISEYSKKDLIETYGLSPDRVEVTYLGYDKDLFNRAPPDTEASAALLARWGIRKPFILHHGMVQLRKNVHRLIEAWDRVHEMCTDFDAQLVLAGPLGLGNDRIMKVREASPRRNQIVLTGALTDSELATLVKNATLCVIPSLYEGFCLPMLEAMACGVPTVASNTSCMPEISGAVLEYFDPYSIEEMSHVMHRALEDSSLRDRLRQKGLSRASEFSWERCARETVGVFMQTSSRRISARLNGAGPRTTE